MGLLNFFTGGGGDQIAKPIEAITGGLDKLFTSDEERLDKQTLLERIKQQPHALLNKLYQIDAQSADAFARRARPFSVYVSSLNFAQLGVGVMWFERTPPEWYITASVTAFLGGLGIYGLARTVEKLGKK